MGRIKRLEYFFMSKIDSRTSQGVLFLEILYSEDYHLTAVSDITYWIYTVGGEMTLKCLSHFLLLNWADINKRDKRTYIFYRRHLYYVPLDLNWLKTPSVWHLMFCLKWMLPKLHNLTTKSRSPTPLSCAFANLLKSSLLMRN